MKNIFKLSFLSLLFLTIMSCSSDDDRTVANGNSAAVLISPQDGAAIVLAEGLEANTALTLVWNHGDYDVATEITYNVEFAVADTDFAAPILAGTTTSRVFTMTVAELNALAKTDAGIAAGTAGELEVRVTSTIGVNEQMPMISNILTISVTPFEATVPVEPVDPVLYIIGAPQAYYGLSAWSPQTAMAMRYIGDGETQLFEAYVKVGTGDGLKFGAAQGEWGDVDAAGNYGLGDAAGTLVNSGGAGNVELAATEGPGLYYVQVDIDNLQFKAVKMNWGIIGAATPGGWDGETAMTYDFDNNKFTITSTLTADEMKFRASNASQFIYGSGESWKFNVGNSDPKVAWDINAPNFTVTAGPHTIELSIALTGEATVSGI